jgi:hypothetical protein
MDPITLILGALFALGSGMIIIEVFHILWTMIVDWFRQHQSLALADVNNIAFTIKRGLSEGKHGLIQGIFNKATDQLVAHQVVQGQGMDDRLRQAHQRHDLVLYN